MSVSTECDVAVVNELVSVLSISFFIRIDVAIKPIIQKHQFKDTVSIIYYDEES